MTFFQFLPLFFGAGFAFLALYSILELEFQPLRVLRTSLVAAARILRNHWRITAALFAVFAATPIVEALFIVALGGREQPLMLAAFVWQGLTAAAIACIATHIHGHALALPPREPAAQRRYRLTSIAVAEAVFLITVAFSVGSSLALVTLFHSPHGSMDFLAHMVRTVLFVPLALIRPALSLGFQSPLRTAFATAIKPPFIVVVWVIALGWPSLAFEQLGAGIVFVHPSPTSVLAFRAAKVVFNVFYCAFFETATLLLLARATRRVAIWKARHSLGSGEVFSPGSG